MQQLRLLIPVFLLIFLFSCNKGSKENTQIEAKDSIPEMKMAFGICVDSLDIVKYKIESGDSPVKIFENLGFSRAEADSIARSSFEHLDPKKLKIGLEYLVFQTKDSIPQINAIAFQKSSVDYVVIPLGTHLPCYSFTKKIRTETHYIEGVINSSLWDCIRDQGVSPYLSLVFSDLFAWQIDFFAIKEGDSFKAIYEESFVDDSISVDIGNIQVAVFNHEEKDYYAIPFEQDSVIEYFDEKGNSLRKAFLKAPLDFFRITSRFSNARYHPVLKRTRAHHGVDYAAPIGTPVKSIGDGTVIAKSYQPRGGGYYLKVKHNATYTTSYMHLSRFAEGINVGKHVKQGEVIAYVGSTGLSTGPHLDFRVYKNGQAINPLTLEAPPSNPIKPELIDSFMQIKDKLLIKLNNYNKQDSLNNNKNENDRNIDLADIRRSANRN